MSFADNYKLSTSHETIQRAAEIYDTPTYLYDEATIKERCRNLTSLFPDLPVNWLYAVKANDNPFILDLIHREKLGFDTVSLEEVLLVNRITEEPYRILYTENNMDDTEMERAVEAGVWLNIGALDRLETLAATHPGTECSIRLNLNIGDGHHEHVITGHRESKFGIPVRKIEEIKKITADGRLTVSGLHIHIGSGIREPANLISAMKKLLEATEYFENLRFVNFGGGLPVAYHEGDSPFDLAEFAKEARPILEQDLKRRPSGFTYWFEPGRWLLAPAGMLISKVTSIKKQGHVTYVGTNTGFNHLIRPLLYDAHHEVINISRPGGPKDETYSISGNICENGDILAYDREMPATQKGDTLAFADAGAYGMVMSSAYNRRALPAEVMVREDGSFRLIRPRSAADQVVDQYLRETGYR